MFRERSGIWLTPQEPLSDVHDKSIFSGILADVLPGANFRKRGEAVDFFLKLANIQCARGAEKTHMFFGMRCLGADLV